MTTRSEAAKELIEFTESFFEDQDRRLGRPVGSSHREGTEFGPLTKSLMEDEEALWIPPTAIAFWVRFTLGLPPLKSTPGLMKYEYRTYPVAKGPFKTEGDLYEAITGHRSAVFK